MTEPTCHYTVAALAARWSCSDQTVYNLISRGHLACVRIGSAIRITAEQVAAYEGAQTCPVQNEISPNTGSDDATTERGTSIGQKIVELNARRRGRKVVLKTLEPPRTPSADAGRSMYCLH